MEARTLELVFPEHTNPLGAAFGGFVLGLMDKVGSYAAARRAKRPVVTVAVGSVEFKVPIRTGDLPHRGGGGLQGALRGGERKGSGHPGGPHLRGGEREGGAGPGGGPCGY